MDIYAAVKLFHARALGFTACIAALDSAPEDLILRLTPEQATRLRIVMLSNNEFVMNEMEKRGPTA
jgi:hypothetical protein